MSKQITAAELAEIVTNILSGDSGELDSIQAHEGFMTDIAKVVCDYCGGEVHHNASPMEDTWYVGIHGNDSLPADGGVWRDYDREGALFDQAEDSPPLEAQKYATGDWMHLFSDNTRRETRCRVLIDLEQSKLVKAQEWTGLKFEDLLGASLDDLAESVIDANEAHLDPVAHGLETTFELPQWATGVESQSGSSEDAREQGQGAQRLVVIGVHAPDACDPAPDYCAFRVDEAFIQRVGSLAALCEANDLAQVNVTLYPELWGPAGFEEDARLQDGELVVYRNGNFVFTDIPKNSSVAFESRLLNLPELQALLQSSDEDVVYATDEVKSQYVADHAFTL